MVPGGRAPDRPGLRTPRPRRRPTTRPDRPDLHQVLHRLSQRRGSRRQVLARNLTPRCKKGPQNGPALLPGDRQGKPDDPPAHRRGEAERCRPRVSRVQKPSEIALDCSLDRRRSARAPQGAEPDRLALIVPKIRLARRRSGPIIALDASRDGKLAGRRPRCRGRPLPNAGAGEAFPIDRRAHRSASSPARSRRCISRPTARS